MELVSFVHSPGGIRILFIKFEANQTIKILPNKRNFNPIKPYKNYQKSITQPIQVYYITDLSKTNHNV